MDCPPGTAPAVQPVPGKSETEAVCLRPDGRREGPAERRDAAGQLIASGSYVDGRPEGTWKLVENDGMVRVGEMKAGVPVGPWTTLSGATPVATVTWGHLRPGAPGRAPAAPSAAAAPPAGDAAVRWTAALGDRAVDLVIDGPQVWAMGRTAVHLLDADTGALRLSAAPGAALTGELVLGATVGLAVTAAGELLVIDPAAGDWRRLRTPLGITHVAGADADEAWVRDGSGRLAVVDLRAGTVRWQAGPYLDPVSPIVEDDALVGVREQSLVAVDPRDGEAAWTRRLDAPPVALAGGDGLVAALGAHGELSLLRADSGSLRWTTVLPGIAGGARIEVQADAVVVQAGTTVHRRSLLDGGPLPTAPLPAALRGDAELLGERLCVATPTGLWCADADGDWTAGAGPAAGAPRVGAGLVLVPLDDGRLQAIDPMVARLRAGLLPGEGGELIQDREVEAEVAAAGGAVDQLSLPLVELVRPSPTGACTERRAWIDLQGAAPWPTAAAAFGGDTAPGPETPGAAVPEAPAPGGPAPDAPAADAPAEDAPAEDDRGPGAGPARGAAALPWVRLEPLALPAPAVPIDPAWQLAPAGAQWSMAWWYRWQPVITSARLRTLDPTAQAGVEAALACAGPPVAFDGEVTLQERSVVAQPGGRKKDPPVLQEVEINHNRAGRLSLHPQPQDIDGIGGCLIEVRRNGSSEGWWASPVLGAWERMVVTVDDPVAPIVSTDAQGPRAGLPAVVEGTLAIELLEPGGAAPTTGSGTGAFRLELVQDDLLATQRFEVWTQDRPWLSLRADGLRPALVELDDGVWVPVPEEREFAWFTFSAPVPPPEDLVLLWAVDDCGAPAPADAGP